MPLCSGLGEDFLQLRREAAENTAARRGLPLSSWQAEMQLSLVGTWYQQIPKHVGISQARSQMLCVISERPPCQVQPRAAHLDSLTPFAFPFCEKKRMERKQTALQELPGGQPAVGHLLQPSVGNSPAAPAQKRIKTQKSRDLGRCGGR